MKPGDYGLIYADAPTGWRYHLAYPDSPRTLCGRQISHRYEDDAPVGIPGCLCRNCARSLRKIIKAAKP